MTLQPVVPLPLVFLEGPAAPCRSQQPTPCAHDRRTRIWRWLSGKVVAPGWLGGADGMDLCRRGLSWVSHSVSAAIQWLWSFMRLCVAATSRHSDNAAVRPLRWKRLILRLNLICANTGSTVDFRCL